MSSAAESSDRESVSGGAGGTCCSGASLTAAVLTHINHEDSEETTPIDVGVAPSNGQAGEEGREREGRREGETREPCGEGEGGGVVLKSPTKTARRRSSKHSPSKKRENEDGIQELLESIPEVAEEFDVLSKIGEGTFSSVYVATVKGIPEKRFAIKHLIPTSSSARIENELKFLQLLGGRDNVISVCCCLRHRDHVALVMPYFQHDRFTEYVSQMTVAEARLYMRSLFLALRNIHSHHIIHRDIKPSNFLYNRATKQFQLVDFGLAHVENQKSTKDQKDQSKSRSHKRTSTRSSMTSRSASSTAIANGPTSSHAAVRLNGIVAPPPTYQRQLHHRVATRAAAANAGAGTRQSVGGTKTKMAAPSEGKGGGGGGSRREGEGGKGGRSTRVDREVSSERDEVIALCPLRHKVTEVCTACLARSHQVAPRAGTPGFRAPEVLLKYPHQTTAVDVWSAGVILLCILSGHYPFFKAHDDMSALAQIVSLLGSKKTAEAAKSCGKSLICDPEVEAMDLKALCSKLRFNLSKTAHSKRDRTTQPAPHKKLKRSEHEISSNCLEVRRSPRKVSPRCGATGCHDNDRCHGDDVESDSDSWNQVPDSAFDLLYKCLDLNPATRITAELALQHNFMVDNT